MNRYLSVMELYFKNKMKYALGAMILTFGVEFAALYFLGFRRYDSIADSFSNSFFMFIFLGGCLLLIIALDRGKTNEDIRLKLLGLSKTGCLYVERFVNFVYMMIFYGVQVLLLVLVITQFYKSGLDPAGGIGIFSDIYKVNILFCLMPMGAPLFWVRNIGLIIYISLVFRGDDMSVGRRISDSITIFIMLVVFNRNFNSLENYEQSAIIQLAVTAVLVGIIVLIDIFSKDKTADEEE